MKAYLAVFRMRFIGSLQYRAAAFAGLVTQFAWGFLLLLGYQAFYRADPAAFPMSLEQLAAYVWLQQAFLALYMTWFVDGDIVDALSSGDIAYDLARPVDLYWRWFAQSSANRLARALLRCAPTLLVAFFLPAPFRLPLPQSLWHLLAFALSTAMSLGIATALLMVIYTSGIRTLSIAGIRTLAQPLVDLLAGAIIPLPFFPAGIQQIVQLLPFAALQNLPLRLYSGHIWGQAAWQGLMLQCFWLVALSALGHVLMHRALRRVVVQGG